VMSACGLVDCVVGPSAIGKGRRREFVPLPLDWQNDLQYTQTIQMGTRTDKTDMHTNNPANILTIL
jgi:hypothetical protein